MREPRMRVTTKRPTHVQVELRENESVERLIKRFTRKCKDGKLQELFMEKYWRNANFTKPSDAKRMKKRRAHFNQRRETEKEKE